MPEPAARYLEPGGSWRPFWLIATGLAVLLVLDRTLLGAGVPPLVWLLSFGAVLGVVAAGCQSARRLWTVRVDPQGPDAGLWVGRERVPLAEIDLGHLQAVVDGAAGADAGAPLLGGGWSLPRGRAGLPLRLADGRTVVVPTRSPAALSAALLETGGDTRQGVQGAEGH